MTSKRHDPHPPGRNYVMYANGSGGTIEAPAPGAIGVVLNDPEGNCVARISEAIGSTTRNAAVYQALITGLRAARDRGIDRIRVFIDVEMVADQVNGAVRVTGSDTRKLHAETLALVVQFANRRVCWITRKMNEEAHKLADNALSGAVDR